MLSLDLFIYYIIKMTDVISNTNKNNIASNTKSDNFNNLIEVEDNEKKFREEALNILNYQQNIIKFNVSGEIFAIRKEVLMTLKDTMFYKIIISKKFDLTKEIYIDKNSKYFGYIMNYFRNYYFLVNQSNINEKDIAFNNKKLIENMLSDLYVSELEEFKHEVEFYDLFDILNICELKFKRVKFINYEISSHFLNSKFEKVADYTVEAINNFDQNTGLCADKPGWITLELEFTTYINGLEINKFCGNPLYWKNDKTKMVDILVSEDNKMFKKVGNISINTSNQVNKLNFKKIKTKFIKIISSSSESIGISYVNVFIY